VNDVPHGAEARARIGRRLRRAREDAGLTQRELAARLGVNPTYVTNLEAGRVNATIEKLADVAGAFGGRLKLEIDGPPSGNTRQPEAATSARRDELLDRVADHILEHGVIRFSLRSAAKTAGTTHRLLLYHFGSAPALVRETLARIRVRRAERAASNPPPPPAPGDDTLLIGAWRAMVDDQASARALLEGLAMAVADPDYQPIAVDAIEQYLPFLEMPLPQDWTNERRRHVASVLLAVLRGMMLDQLATGDSARLDGAIREWDEAARRAGWDPSRSPD
jgi:transcriptional regulator with XRE-family HTH domain